MEIELDFIDRGGIAVAIPLELMRHDADFSSYQLVDDSDHNDTDHSLDNAYSSFDEARLVKTRRGVRTGLLIDDLGGSGVEPS